MTNTLQEEINRQLLAGQEHDRLVKELEKLAGTVTTKDDYKRWREYCQRAGLNEKEMAEITRALPLEFREPVGWFEERALAAKYAVKRDDGGEMRAEFKYGRIHEAWRAVVESLPANAWAVVKNRLALVTDAKPNMTTDCYGKCIPFGNGGQCQVYLNPDLRVLPLAFVKMAVAHELGHVYSGQRAGTLENERAADAAAASWGYPSDGARRHRAEQFITKGLWE